MFNMNDLRDFKILTNTAQPGISCAELRISSTKLIFNKLAAAELGYPKYVNVLFGKDFQEAIVLPTEEEDTQFAIAFYTSDEYIDRKGNQKKRTKVELCNKSLAKSIRKKRGWGGNAVKKVCGIRYREKNALYFDLRKAEDSKRVTRAASTDMLLESLPTLETALSEMKPVFALPAASVDGVFIGEVLDSSFISA